MHQIVLERLCIHFDLGVPQQDPQPVYGGLLHKMWRVNTDRGSFAVKQLSPDVQLTNPRVVKNYEYSEQIAAHFIKEGLPAISAIQQSGKYLFIIDNTGFLAYPWVDAKAFNQHDVSENHALKIAAIMAQMHRIHINAPDIILPECFAVTQKKIFNLINQVEQFHCPFSGQLRENQDLLLYMLEAYQKASLILKSDLVMSHNDLDQKNVLWDHNNNPFLIDWESVGPVNPTSDIINTAFYWSGITTDFNDALFFKMIHIYQKSGGFFQKNHVMASCYGTLNWLGWLVYNIERACVAEESEGQTSAFAEVHQTLATILRLEAVIPEVVKGIGCSHA